LQDLGVKFDLPGRNENTGTGRDHLYPGQGYSKYETPKYEA